MKRLVPTLILLTVGASLFALPLTAVIFQESAALSKKVDAWNQQCGGKPYYDEACAKKRKAISAELGQFVALVNDELNALGDTSPEATDDMVKQFNDRRNVMEFEVRNALHVIKCLGLPASNAQCSAEAVDLEQQRASLQEEYAQAHAEFDGNWISLKVTSVSALWKGLLTTGAQPTGGKTGGVILKTERNDVFELNLGKDEELRRLARQLNGKKVQVTGEYKPRAGAQASQQRVILVKTLRTADYVC